MARLTATLAVAAALLMAVGVAGAGAAASAAAACAPGCSCNGGGMSCAELGLTALPEGTWPSVTLLNVSGNALSSLGALGERFPALRVLLARDNRVAELPLDAVAGPRAPPRLVAVDLSRNAIRRVLPPAEAASGGGSLNDLALLYLGGNRLATLDPEVFSRLPRLQHLSLNDNPLVVPAGRPLLAHPRLAALDLRRVDARALSSTTLAALPALEEVALESSRVRSIGGVFAHLPLLDSVYLQSNEITEIPVDSFSKDAHLSHLSLDFNPLQSVDPAALPVRDRGELHIRGTPLACSCAHEQVARWAAEHRIKLLASCSEAPVCPFANVVMP